MHFTYKEQPDTEQLKQGDVLEKNSELVALLQEYYPHCASAEDYTHLMVITQSCDLVKRDTGLCRSPHVTLAIVKPIDVVLHSQLTKYRNKEPFQEHGKVCALDRKRDFIRFLERLWNNNEVEYFYLHEDTELAFPKSSCACLRISITLRTEHYDKLCAVKRLELSEIFRAKLGWMVGTIYSRVGTEDWVPTLFPTSGAFREHIETIADSRTAWLEKNRIRRLRNLWRTEGSVTSQAQLLVEKESANRCGMTRKQRMVQSIIQKLRGGDIIQEEQQKEIEKLLHDVDDINNLQGT